ncbi:MAG: threonylcarbamoyl-AMP synthase [Deltaproteobacteria bacterium]|nr:MAG: threonylcarbamoyl-AMP synthase [Deltaproteobacteria bacterium]
MSARSVTEAVAQLRAGGLVGYPTETVWGLGADATSQSAVDGLRRWKGRQADQPISILVESAAALGALGFTVSPLARALMKAFWPGPLSLVLPCRRAFARGIARADGAVGVRCSSHPVAAALAAGLSREGVGPITSTSLNRSGEAPARSAQEARAICGDASDAPQLLDEADAPPASGASSTVVDLCGAEPVVRRWGAVPRERIEPLFAGGGGS